MEDRREPLKLGTRVQLESGGLYEITGEPIGYGGGSIIYPVHRIPAGKNTGQDELEYALKECFPVSGVHRYVRDENGEIVPECSADKEYLSYIKKKLLEEEKVSQKIYRTSSRTLPIRESANEVTLFQGDQEAKVHNTVTIMDSLGRKGRSLASYMKEYQHLSLVRTFMIVQQILVALREIHEAGYLHLDIQDGNIFVQGTLGDTDTMVTLIDLGSSRKLVEGQTEKIKDQVLFTTEGFTPPEILLRNDGNLQLGPESDLYSVGCLILYLLTGEKYSTERLIQTTDQRYLTRFKLRKIECPRHLVDRMQSIIAKALENEVEDRYHSAEEMLDDVTEFVEALRPYKSELSQTKYDAFVCYRHGPVDSQAAVMLQRQLEHFHVSKDIAGNRRPFHRVFVDEGELSSCADFGEQIREALKNASWLIVLCSKKTPESAWVQLEIDTFLEYHDKSHILAVLTEGEPEQSFPLQLRGKPDGTGEVLAADARGCDKSEVLRNLRGDALLKIAAPMLNTTFDALKQRRKVYVMQRAAGVAALALGVTAGFSIYAISQNQKLQAQYESTLINQSRYLAQVSENLLESGDRIKAIQVALSALPDEEDGDKRPVVDEAVSALTNAVGAYQKASFNRFSVSDNMHTDATLSYGKVIVSPEENFTAVIDDSGKLYLYETQDHTRIEKVDAVTLDPDEKSPEIYQSVFLSEEKLILFFKDRVCCWNFMNDKVIWSCEYSSGMEIADIGEIPAVYQKDNDSLYFASVFSAENDLYVLDGSSGEIKNQIEIDHENNYYNGVSCLAVSESGDHVAVGFELSSGDDSESIYFIDLEKDTCQAYDGIYSPEYNFVYELFFLSETQVVSIEATIQKEENASSTSSFEQMIPYQVSCYSFDDGKAAWKYEDQYSYRDENGAVAYLAAESYSMFPATLMKTNQEFDSGTEKEILFAQFGNQMLYLDQETGKCDGKLELAYNIVGINMYAKDRQFVLLENGVIYQIVGAVNASQIGSYQGTVSGAACVTKDDSFLTLSEDENRITILNNRFEDENYIELDFDYDSAIGYGYLELPDETYRYIWEDQEVRLYEPHSAKPAITYAIGTEVDIDSFFLAKNEEHVYALDLADEFNEAYLERTNEQGDKETYDFHSNLVDVIGVKNDTYYLFDSDEDGNGTIYVFDMLAKTLEPQTYSIGSMNLSSFCALSDDNRYLAAFASDYASEDYDTLTLNVYDFIEKKWLDMGEFSDIEADELAIDSEMLAFVPDTHRLAVKENDQIMVLDLEGNERAQTLDVHCYTRLCLGFLSEDLLVTVNDNYVLQTWDIKTGECLDEEQLDAGSASFSVAEYPDEGEEKYFYIMLSKDLSEDSKQYVFRYTKDGTFTKYLELSSYQPSVPSMEDEEILALGNGGNGNYSIVAYRLHTLEDLTRMANKLTKNEELTELEKNTYFLENNVS